MTVDRFDTLERQIQELRERLSALESGNTDATAMLMGSFGLTLTQANILTHLIKRKFCTRQMILDAIWGLSADPPTMNTLHVHIFNIRAKLKKYDVEIPHFQGDTISIAPAVRRQITKMMTGNYVNNVHVVEIRAGAKASGQESHQ